MLSNSGSRAFLKNEQAAWGKRPCSGNDPLGERFLEDPVRVNALHSTHKGKFSDRFQEAVSADILLKNLLSIHQDEDSSPSWPGCTGPLRSTMPRHRRAAATRAGARPALSQELQFFHCLDDPGLTPSTGLCAVTGPCCIQASAGHPGQLTEAEDCWFP